MTDEVVASSSFGEGVFNFLESSPSSEPFPTMDLEVGGLGVVRGLTGEQLVALRAAIVRAEAILRHRREQAILAKNHSFDF